MHQKNFKTFKPENMFCLPRETQSATDEEKEKRSKKRKKKSNINVSTQPEMWFLSSVFAWHGPVSMPDLFFV